MSRLRAPARQQTLERAGASEPGGPRSVGDRGEKYRPIEATGGSRTCLLAEIRERRMACRGFPEGDVPRRMAIPPQTPLP